MGIRKPRVPYENNHKTIDGLKYKRCSICEQWLRMNDNYFYKNKTSKVDGFNPYCKECTKKKSRIYAEENREWYLTYQKQWYEDNLDYKQKQNRDYIANNWDDVRLSARDWRQNNPDKVKINNDKRMMHKKHNITDTEWDICKEFFDNSCAYCGLPMEKHFVYYRNKLIIGDFHKEHFDHDGSNDITNCIPSCKECNSRKHDKTFEDWYNENNVVFDRHRFNNICKWIFEVVHTI